MKEELLGEICDFSYGEGLREDRRKPGKVPVYGSNGIVGWHNQAVSKGPTIVIGRKGSIGEVHFSPIPCWPIDTTYYVEAPKKECDLRWLYRALVALDLTKLNKAAAVPGLNREDAYRKRILFPDVSEQERIAALLEKADTLRRTRRYARQLSDTFLQSVFLEMFGEPVRNVKGWPRESLSELGNVVTGSTPPSVNAGMFGEGMPFVTPGDLEVNTLRTKRFVTGAGAKHSRLVRKGSTLVCCIGATIGKTDQAQSLSAFNQQINAVDWKSDIDDSYGLFLMRFFSKEVAARGRSTTLPILKKSAFEEIAVPIAPLPLQQEFAGIVRCFERLRAQARESERQAEHLFQTLLQNAFAPAS